MTKADLIEKLAKEARIKKAAAGRAVESFVSNVVESLKSDGNVVIAGLGTFKLKTSRPRTGRNPKTGETIQIPSKKRVSFKAGVGLKKAVQ